MRNVQAAKAWTAPSEPAPLQQDQLSQVCGAVAAVFRRACGRGPAKTSAHWAAPNMLVVLLEDGHTDAEKTMRATGHVEHLVDRRHLLQTLIEDDLEDAVAGILRRPVLTTLSATRLDPDLSAEIFLLGPVEF